MKKFIFVVSIFLVLILSGLNICHSKIIAESKKTNIVSIQLICNKPELIDDTLFYRNYVSVTFQILDINNKSLGIITKEIYISNIDSNKSTYFEAIDNFKNNIEKIKSEIINIQNEYES